MGVDLPVRAYRTDGFVVADEAVDEVDGVVQATVAVGGVVGLAARALVGAGNECAFRGVVDEAFDGNRNVSAFLRVTFVFLEGIRQVDKDSTLEAFGAF